MAEATIKAGSKKSATKSTVKSTEPVASKPAAKSSVAAAAAPKKAVAAKPRAPTGVAKASAAVTLVSDEQRYRMVAEAAYYLAESHQFKSDPVRDWIEAEAQVAALLKGSKQGQPRT